MNHTRMTGPALLLTAVLAAGSPVKAEEFAVGVVPSDAPELAQPGSRDQELTADQVLGMVRRAVDLIGGMAAVVPDTARLVVIKPNVVSPKPSGSGVVTDVRVARAVALLVHEAVPAARIVVGEGGGWVLPSQRDQVHAPTLGPEDFADGFAAAGYREMVAELRQRGVEIECLDLNFDRVRSLQVPGGGLATDEYSVAATIMDADAWINCPVAKTHGAKITCCMKNQFGLLPGMVYGWNKSVGTDRHPGMPHSPRVVDEAWVDLWMLTRMDLNVVDLIAGTEGGAFAGAPKRANIVVAGRDPVATDLVVARLMGFNPDDFEFADLAAQRGLGPGSIDRVVVRGGRVEALAARYRKAGFDYSSGSEWREQATYGMGPRRWIVLGPLPADHAWSEAELLALDPEPDQGGWSPEVWFGHDRIDLDRYLGDPVNCAVYAFARFTMPQADSVRFWSGSDEGLQVWIDGVPIYAHAGARRHRLGQDRVHGFLAAGEHRLLARVEQTRGPCDFSINVCEPIDEELYAGNRYPGVRYFLARGEGMPMAITQRVKAVDRWDPGVVPVAEGELTRYDAMAAARAAPDSLQLDRGISGASRQLLGVMAEVAGVSRPDLDEATMTCLGADAFILGTLGLHHEGETPAYGPDLGRVAAWLGLRCGLYYGLGYRETGQLARGWIAHGMAPVLQFERSWAKATGFRQRGGQIELHLVGSDTVSWIPIDREWWGNFPGGSWRPSPLVVAEVAGEALPPAVLTDSLAALALELGLRPWVEDEPESWGRRGGPAGLAAWDAWVSGWERRTFTSREELSDLGWMSWFVQSQAEARGQAAAYFAQAARRAPGQRGDELAAAAQGYTQASKVLGKLAQALRTADSPKAGNAERRVRDLARTRHWWRQAREGERQALAALAHYLGRPPLPPATEDPLRLRAQGRRLLTWRASVSKGVESLTMRGGSAELAHLAGRPIEGGACEVHAPLPAEPGWQVAIETVKGDGTYTVVLQPGAANGWTLVVRIDDEWARVGNQTELVVWALPGEP